MPARLKKGQWSKKHSCCIDCGRTSITHACKGRCKSCYSKFLYHTDPERKRKQKIYTRDWMRKNPERTKDIVAKAVKKYATKNREKIKTNLKAKYDANPEYYKEYSRKYYAKNRARVRELRRINHLKKKKL